MLRVFDVSNVMDSKSKDYDRMTAFIDLHDTVRELLKVQAEDKPENEIKAVQQKLSTQYDDFYKKYGLLHSHKNRQILRDDCSYNLLLTLEKGTSPDIASAGLTINDVNITELAPTGNALGTCRRTDRRLLCGRTIWRKSGFTGCR